MGFLQNLNIGGGIANVIDSIFGGVSQTIGAASDAAAANPELASAALGAAAGVPIPAGSGAGATSSANGGTKDQKLFDNVTNQNESAWKWPAIVAGVVVVLLIVWKLVSPKKGGYK